jgi:tRNA pseudouridine55 synthase
MDGILNINKAPGLTSFAIVSRVRRLSGEHRAGHAGTLDPTACGVLPVCLGQGTRVVEFLMDAVKVYRARIEMGVTTDTYDATGNITHQADPSPVSQRRIEEALHSFRGSIEQVPPMYSALKYKGQRLYNLARAGITINRKSRTAHIHRLKLVCFEPPLFTLEIECGKGTYVRSLAHDLGQLLSCGAHLKELARLRYGPFTIKDASTLEQIEQGENDWQRLLYPIDFVLSHWPAVVLGEEQERLVRNGSIIELSEGAHSDKPGRCRAYSHDGTFLAVLSLDSEKGHWQPQKVFARPYQPASLGLSGS